MDNNPIDYGKLALMRVEDLEAGVRITAVRPRFGSIKINTYPHTDISGRSVGLGSFGAAGSVSIIAKLTLRIASPAVGGLELRVNSLTAAAASLEERAAVGALDIILVGAVAAEGGDNLITAACTGAATLLASEIIVSGEGVSCRSTGGINYAFAGNRAVILAFRDNRIYANIMLDGNLASELYIGRGAAADIIADGGAFKIVYIDDERNLWYAEITDGGIKNLRRLAGGFDSVALLSAGGGLTAAVGDGSGRVMYARIRNTLGRPVAIEGANNIRSFCAVKGGTRPALVLTGFNNRSVVRTAADERYAEMGTVRGRLDYRIL